MEETEQDIAKYEAQIETLENCFTQGETSDEQLRDYEKAKHQLSQKMYEWELQQEEIEALKLQLQ